MKKKINAGSVDELFEIVNAVQKGQDPEEYLNERRKEQQAEAEAKARAEAEAQKAAEEEAAAKKAAEEEAAAAAKAARREEAAARRAARREEAADKRTARKAEREKAREERRAAKTEETKPDSSEAEHVGDRILRSLHMEHVEEAPSEEEVEELVKDLPIHEEEEEEASGEEQTAEEAKAPAEEAAEEAKAPAEATEEAREPDESAGPQPEMVDLMKEAEPAEKDETDEAKGSEKTGKAGKHSGLAGGIATVVMLVMLGALGVGAVLYRPEQTAEPEEDTETIWADDVTAPEVTAEKSDGTIKINASDAGSGVDAIWYAVVSDDGLIQIPEYQKYTAPIPYHSGQTYYFYAVDNAGNCSDPSVTQMDTPSYPPVPGQAVVTISAVGDCTLGSDQGNSSAGSFPAYAYSYGDSYFFENVRDILENDDVTFANLEGPLTTTSTYQDKEFIFKGDPSYTSILQDGSIEVVTLANNHTSDYGAKGLADTEEALTEADIGYCIGSTVDYQDIGGVTAAFIGIYEEEIGAAYEQETSEAITRARENGAQLIIVAYHWGEENATTPGETQQEVAHAAIDMGADLVVGHHPHVLQGIEKYNGKYIVYSLGNFCFGGNTSPSDIDTMIFRQTFIVNPDGVEENDDIEIIPCTISTTSEYNDFRPTPATGEKADEIMERINTYSAAFGNITYTASTGL